MCRQIFLGMGQVYVSPAVPRSHMLQKMSQVIKYGIIVVSTLPIVCVYPFLQKYFVKGVMIGSIKG